jgi:hypothetical protein
MPPLGRISGAAAQFFLAQYFWEEIISPFHNLAISSNLRGGDNKG